MRALILLAAAIALSACSAGDGANPGGGHVTGPAPTGSATLSWLPPGENQDGTPVGDIAGYYIYYGTKANQLDHVVKVTDPALNTFEIRDLPAGTYYFSMRAYRSAGTTGLASSLVTKTIR